VADVDEVAGVVGVGTRKLSGILAESVIEGDHVLALVVGIGINVNWPAEVPVELADIAVAEPPAGREVDRAELLVALLERFDHWYGELGTASGRAALHARYRELSATLGRRVRVELRDEVVVGDAVDLTDDGHLVVEVAAPQNATEREITVGVHPACTIRRPTTERTGCSTGHARWRTAGRQPMGRCRSTARAFPAAVRSAAETIEGSGRARSTGRGAHAWPAVSAGG
jgi:hypothetical protein